jgi:hypothetical protein
MFTISFTFLLVLFLQKRKGLFFDKKKKKKKKKKKNSDQWLFVCLFCLIFV